MYSVSAAVNDVRIVTVPLLTDSFLPDTEGIESALAADAERDADSEGRIKLIYLCSPGNPTGTLIPRDAVERLLAHPTWNGLVVVDEAYVDFSGPNTSVAPLVTAYPNLVVMQTLSKGFGLAGIRLGSVFAAPEVAALLNAMKAPYNIPEPTSQLAHAALSPASLAHSRSLIAQTLSLRDRLVADLPRIPGIGAIRGGLDANFLLVELCNIDHEPDNEVALRVYERLAEEKGVVVRFRGREWGCEGCLRITVGTGPEVDRFLEELSLVLADVREEVGGRAVEDADEAADTLGPAPVGTGARAVSDASARRRSFRRGSAEEREREKAASGIVA